MAAVAMPVPSPGYESLYLQAEAGFSPVAADSRAMSSTNHDSSTHPHTQSRAAATTPQGQAVDETPTLADPTASPTLAQTGTDQEPTMRREDNDDDEAIAGRMPDQAQQSSNGSYSALGNGPPPQTALPRPRAKSAQVAAFADWNSIGAANGSARSSSLAVPSETNHRQSYASTASHDGSLPPPVPSSASSRSGAPASRLPSSSRGIAPSTSISSNLSIATSNSSHLANPLRQSLPQPAAPHPTPRPGSGSAFSTATDPDGVAALVQQLYARLDSQGVYGDGWDEGKERSRDGIILRFDRDREAAPVGPRQHPKTPVIPDDPDLAAKADSVLKRVDRYGFFSNSHPAAVACQHHRLATLSTAPFRTIPSISPKKRNKKVPPPAPGSSPAPDDVPPRSDAPPLNHRASTVSLMPANKISPEKIALETKRIDKWGAMLSVAHRDSGGNAQDWSVNPSWWSGRVPGGGGGQSGKYRRLQRRVFKGVPDRWRRAVWGMMMEKMAEEVAPQSRTRVPNLAELEKEYKRLVQQPYVQDVQIDLDVPRTISGHVLFHTRYGQGQRALFHVLHAFGLRSDENGGYCQGMGPIAATLLCYFEPERAYAGLARLFDQYRLSHIFAPGFPGLHEVFYVQQQLVELLMPEVQAAFEEQMVSTSAYATKWYITLFANSVPFATQLRLWDGLLLEGIDFLIVTAVSIIWHFQHDFTGPDASFESILSRLSSYFYVESDDALLRWIRKTLRVKGLREKMKAWRTEWQGFVRDGTSEGRIS